MGNEYGMIFALILGNYPLPNPTSFTGKIAWDFIGNINWGETGRSAGWIYIPSRKRAHNRGKWA